MILRWLTPTGLVQSLEFDATTRVMYGRGATITEHPIEGDAAHSDHARPGQRRLVCTCWVSDKPTRSIGTARGQRLPLQITTYSRTRTRAVSTSGGPGTNIPLPGVRLIPIGATDVSVQPSTYRDQPVTQAAQVLQFPVRFDRVKDALEVLDRLIEDSTVVTAITGMREWTNLQIEDVSAPKGPPSAIEFTITLREIRTSATRLIDAPTPLEPRGERREPQGPRAGYTLSEQEESSVRALLGGDS